MQYKTPFTVLPHHHHS